MPSAGVGRNIALDTGRPLAKTAWKQRRRLVTPNWPEHATDDSISCCCCAQLGKDILTTTVPCSFVGVPVPAVLEEETAVSLSLGPSASRPPCSNPSFTSFGSPGCITEERVQLTPPRRRPMELKLPGCRVGMGMNTFQEPDIPGCSSSSIGGVPEGRRLLLVCLILSIKVSVSRKTVHAKGPAYA